MLEGRDGQGAAAAPPYQPPVSDLWQMPDAIRRVRQLLAARSTWQPLVAFLPEIPAAASHRDLRCRAAVASTLMAGLELAREGTLAAQQSTAFGPIHFRSPAPSSEAAPAHLA
jgi:segregation and condensation protein A